MDEKDGHLGRERIAALVDGEGPGDGANAHLEGCDRCRREYELMRRMRMALSAMDGIPAPSGEWDRIASRLPASTAGGSRSDLAGFPGRVLAAGSGTALRAAAAVLLFAGGLAVGSGLAPDGSAGGEAATPAGPTAGAAGGSGSSGGPAGDAAGALAGAGADAGAGVDALASDGTAAEAFRRLEKLRARGPSPDEVYRDPASAAEHLARLDALIRASREALRSDPADPALNDFLFEVVEERETYDQALQMASLEYR